MNKYLSIITINVYGLNAPIRRHRVAEWIGKYDPQICFLQETHLRTKDQTSCQDRSIGRYNQKMDNNKFKNKKITKPDRKLNCMAV